MPYADAFAAVYDLFTENADYGARTAYLKKLLRENGVRDGIVLDLACGTGTVAASLASDGYDVIAVDASPDMLTQAREKLACFGQRVLFLCQDMRALDLYGTVRATVCTLDSINHLLTPADVQTAFCKVALFTEPGGVFIFDVNSQYKHREVLADNCFVYETDDRFLVWQNALDPQTDTVEMLLDIFTLRPDGSYERDGDEITERAYGEAALCEMLRTAGFSDVRVYGDLTQSPPEAKAERLCFVAVK